MNRLLLSNSWRPSWKSFFLTYLAIVASNLLLFFLAWVFTGDSGLEISFPPKTWAAWVAILFNLIAIPCAVGQFVWLLFRPTPPEPHPFVTREYWLAFTLSVVAGIVVTLLTSPLGWTNPSRASSTTNGIDWGDLLFRVAVFTIVFVLMSRWPRVMAGLACGGASYLAAALCVVFGWPH